MLAAGLAIYVGETEQMDSFSGQLEAPDYSVWIEHGRLFQTALKPWKQHTAPTLLVSDATVALATALSLNGNLMNAHIRIEPINAQQDALVWLPKLARMRAWSLLNNNRIDIVLSGYARQSHRSRWLNYSSMNDIAPETSALSNLNRHRYG